MFALFIFLVSCLTVSLFNFLSMCFLFTVPALCLVLHSTFAPLIIFTPSFHEPFNTFSFPSSNLLFKIYFAIFPWFNVRIVNIVLCLIISEYLDASFCHRKSLILNRCDVFTQRCLTLFSCFFLPGENNPSPSPFGQPTISLIFLSVSCSISTKTGAIS